MKTDIAEWARRFSKPVLTRFAPSTTGYLHAGHVMNAMYVWGIARALGGRVLLRIEDHDRGRHRPEYEDAILEDLEWLGFSPDLGEIPRFRAGSVRLRQSDNQPYYEEVLGRLESEHQLYYCDCSRKALTARAGGGSEGAEIPYDDFCRGRGLGPATPGPSSEPGRGLRLVSPPESVRFHDLLLGDIEQSPREQCGDLLLKDRNGNWTYQFAVTADDYEQEINLVIRGRDLLESTGRQIMLGEMLGRREPAVFLHHDLLLEPDGRKLSKRFGSPAIRDARGAGKSAADVLGEIAVQCELLSEYCPLTVEDLPALFLD